MNETEIIGNSFIISMTKRISSVIEIRFCLFIRIYIVIGESKIEVKISTA